MGGIIGGIGNQAEFEWESGLLNSEKEQETQSPVFMCSASPCEVANFPSISAIVDRANLLKDVGP
jgi:hypothetical protein